MELSAIKKSDNSYVANDKSSLEKVGDFLREARQGRNLSVEDLSSSLRIGKEQLIALEKGDESSLPEKVFIRAMVRRIAEKLNLDTSFIIEELDKKKKNEPKHIQLIKKEPTKIHKNFNPISLVILSGILGLITSFIVLNHIEGEESTSLKTIKIQKVLLDNHKTI